MSLGQREFGTTFIKDVKKEMSSSKHIELGRSGTNITVREYLISGAGIQPLTPVSYSNSKIKFTAGRCMVVDIQSDMEYYDCKYDDCVIKTINS